MTGQPPLEVDLAMVKQGESLSLPDLFPTTCSLVNCLMQLSFLTCSQRIVQPQKPPTIFDWMLFRIFDFFLHESIEARPLTEVLFLIRVGEKCLLLSFYLTSF